MITFVDADCDKITPATSHLRDAYAFAPCPLPVRVPRRLQGARSRVPTIRGTIRRPREGWRRRTWRHFSAWRQPLWRQKMVVLPSWAPCWSVEVCASAPGRARATALERRDSAGEQIAQWKAHWHRRRCEIDGPNPRNRTVCSKYLRVNAFSDSVLRALASPTLTYTGNGPWYRWYAYRLTVTACMLHTCCTPVRSVSGGPNPPWSCEPCCASRAANGPDGRGPDRERRDAGGRPARGRRSADLGRKSFIVLSHVTIHKQHDATRELHGRTGDPSGSSLKRPHRSTAARL